MNRCEQSETSGAQYLRVSHSEELEVVVHGLLRLRVPLHFDAEIGALILPVQPAVTDVEQVLLPQIFARGDLYH